MLVYLGSTRTGLGHVLAFVLNHPSTWEFYLLFTRSPASCRHLITYKGHSVEGEWIHRAVHRVHRRRLQGGPEPHGARRDHSAAQVRAHERELDAFTVFKCCSSLCKPMHIIAGLLWATVLLSWTCRDHFNFCMLHTCLSWAPRDACTQPRISCSVALRLCHLTW